LVIATPAIEEKPPPTPEVAMQPSAQPTPAVSYALTTTIDPVKPGQVVQFKLTVTNLTTAAQYLSVGYHVTFVRLFLLQEGLNQDTQRGFYSCSVHESAVSVEQSMCADQALIH
jgi:hypothetical protein